MKLLVLGATGDIGEAVLNAAISAGHDVTAFVRSPDKLGEVRDRIQVIQGEQREFDVVSRSDLEWTMVRPPRVIDGVSESRQR